MKAASAFAHQSWLLYGDFGVGKTTLAATAPAPIILDSDKGVQSIKGRPGYEHVKSEDINDSHQLERAYANLKGTTSKRWDKKFSTLIHDRFEDIQQIALEELQEKIVARNSARDIDSIDKKEWGIMGNRMKRYVRALKTLPMHRIFVCGAMDHHDTGVRYPNLMGGFRNQLPGLVDHVGYVRIGKKGQRWLHLDATEEFYAKTRAWWLTDEQRKIRIPDPSTNPKFLTDLFELIAAGPKSTT